MQKDAMDCGPQCLSVICSHYGFKPDFENLRNLCGASRSGVSLFHLKRAAEQLGFKTRALKLDTASLKEVYLPCVAFVDGNHFCVIKTITDVGVEIFDPAIGKTLLTEREFKARFYCGDENGGYILELEKPGHLNDVSNGKKGLNPLLNLLKYLSLYKKEITVIVMSLFIAGVAQILFPLLTQMLVDKGVENKDVGILVIVLAGELMLLFSSSTASLIQAWVVMFVGARINVSLVYELLGKLIKLPMRYYDTRHSGDILSRITDQYRIETFLTRSSVEIVSCVLAFVVFSVMTLHYSITAFCVMAAGSALYVIWTVHFLPRRKQLDYEGFKNMSDSQDCVIEVVNGIGEIKLNNYFHRKISEWSIIQKRIYRNTADSTRIRQKQDIGATVISEFTNIIVLFFAASQVISGRITLGAMLALQYIAGQMSSPVQRSVELVHDVQDAVIARERQQELLSQKEERDPGKSYCTKLSAGDIILSELSFSYDGALESALENINLVIPQNGFTAIVGESGSGKTTLMKLLLGLYTPTRGVITVGGTPLEDIDITVWRKLCGTVLQEGYIFSASIEENIVQDCKYDREKLKEVSEMSRVMDFVRTMPLGFSTRIGISGQGLSLGQRQRILIARALYKDPKILFFDEATNSLDAKNEQNIWESVANSQLGKKTVIVSAHRLSTVRNADQIIVLSKGRVAETGNHDSLIAAKGVYYQLVKAQMS